MTRTALASPLACACGVTTSAQTRRRAGRASPNEAGGDSTPAGLLRAHQSVQGVEIARSAAHFTAHRTSRSRIRCPRAENQPRPPRAALRGPVVHSGKLRGCFTRISPESGIGASSDSTAPSPASCRPTGGAPCGAPDKRPTAAALCLPGGGVSLVGSTHEHGTHPARSRTRIMSLT